LKTAQGKAQEKSPRKKQSEEKATLQFANSNKTTKKKA